MMIARNGSSGGEAFATSRRDFRAAYAAHRAREGRGPLDEASLLALPWLADGPFAHEWTVRARTFEAFVRGVLDPLARATPAPLRVLDLGAGPGWLCHRMVRMG